MAAAALHGTDIRKILTDAGPVVKAVLLKHMAASGKDDHPAAAIAMDGATNGDVTHRRPVLAHMMEEIELDTTPSKQLIKEILGGPWTFLGQYEDEGTVIMMREPIPGTDDDDDDDDEEKAEEDGDILENLSLEQLQTLCREYYVEVDDDDDAAESTEKAASAPAAATASSNDEEALRQKLIKLLQAARDTMASQVNPHQLQPPFDETVIHGDLLLLRVAKTKEVLDNEDNGDDKEHGERKEPDLTVLSNQEFFLDYTKDEYIAFASRTDVVAPEPPSINSDDEEEDEDDDDDDDAFEVGEDDDDDDDDEGDREGLLNLLMNEVLRRFREENGRGPNTEELLAMRSNVAEKLGVQVAGPSDVGTDEEKEEDADGDKKRAADDSDELTPSKKVKFSASLDEDGDGNDEAAAKPAEAKSAEGNDE